MRKYCFVATCSNSSVRTPQKIFITLPRSNEIRKRWLNAVGRELSSTKGNVFFCEDHFDLENDMENYIEYSLMGGRIFMKSNVVPHLQLQQKIEYLNIMLTEAEPLLPNPIQVDLDTDAIDPLLLPEP